MSEILVRIKDHLHDKHGEYHTWHKAGDVIWVAEDDWRWGDLELGGYRHNGARVYTDHLGVRRPIAQHPSGHHDFFRVIKIPGVSVNEAKRLMTREFQVDTQRDNPYLQKRAFYIDRAKFLTPPLGASLALAAPAALTTPLDRRAAIGGTAVVTGLVAATAMALLPHANELANFWDDDTRAHQFITLHKWDAAHLNAVISKRPMVEH